MSSINAAEISYEHWHRYLYATQFVKDKAVLDIACGEGYGSFVLSKYAKKVIGMDIAQDAVFWASSKYVRENLEFRAGSAAAIPVEGNEVFDIITSFETIEHIPEEDQSKFLKEVKRLLKPDGLFIVSSPNKLTFSDIPNHRNEFHIKEFYLHEYREFLENFFAHVDILGQKIYPVSYIWNPDNENPDFVEYRIQNTGKGFETTDAPKEILYAIAVCSNKASKNQHASIMVDLSGQLIKERDEKIRQQEQLIHQLTPNYHASLYVDTGLGFNEKQVITLPVKGIERKLEFDLAGCSGIKALRLNLLNDLAVIRINSVQLIRNDNTALLINEFKISVSYRNGENIVFTEPTPRITFVVPEENFQKIIFSVDYVAMGRDTYPFLLKNKSEEKPGKIFSLQCESSRRSKPAAGVQWVNRSFLIKILRKVRNQIMSK